MPIKIYVTGAMLEVEKPEDAAALLRLMNGDAAASPKPAGKTLSYTTEDDTVTHFFAAINENARKFLAVLLRYRNGVKADEFAKESGFTTDKFGGTLGGPSKLAKTHKLDFKEFVISEMRNENNQRFRYLAPGPMLVKHASKLNAKGMPVLNFASGGR